MRLWLHRRIVYTDLGREGREALKRVEPRERKLKAQGRGRSGGGGRRGGGEWRALI